MNRVDFMEQLERLLQGIAPAERDEALQYYNDYFDDAGKENEQEVIEALGNPARVAENIKKDLLGSGYGGAVPKAQASDRALVEYGKEPEADEEAFDRASGRVSERASESNGSQSSFWGKSSEGTSGNGFWGKSSEDISGNSFSGYDSGAGQFSGNQTAAGGTAGNEIFATGEKQENRYYESNAYEKPARKAGMPVWAIALLITLLVFASPVVLGLACVLFGLIVCWYALVLCAGVVAVSCLVVLVVLIITGILCCFANPWVGMALMGGGLICGGIGLIFLMLAVGMAGVVTPAFWRGVSRLFRRKHGHSIA